MRGPRLRGLILHSSCGWCESFRLGMAKLQEQAASVQQMAFHSTSIRRIGPKIMTPPPEEC